MITRRQFLQQTGAVAALASLTPANLFAADNPAKAGLTPAAEIEERVRAARPLLGGKIPADLARRLGARARCNRTGDLGRGWRRWHIAARLDVFRPAGEQPADIVGDTAAGKRDTCRHDDQCLDGFATHHGWARWNKRKRTHSGLSEHG